MESFNLRSESNKETEANEKLGKLTSEQLQNGEVESIFERDWIDRGPTDSLVFSYMVPEDGSKEHIILEENIEEAGLEERIKFWTDFVGKLKAS